MVLTLIPCLVRAVAKAVAGATPRPRANVQIPAPNSQSAPGERFTTFTDLRLGPARAPVPSSDQDIEAIMGGAGPEPATQSARLDAVMMPSRLLVISRGWLVGHPLTHEIQAVYAIVGTSLKLQGLQERDK